MKFPLRSTDTLITRDEAAMHADLATRLMWCHGEERATHILQGLDEDAAVDELRWRNLGRNG